MRNKITVNIQGGLGNQLFCYSAGYYVASRINYRLECRMTTQFNSTIRDSLILSRLELPGTFFASKQMPHPKNAFLDRVWRRLIRKSTSILGLPDKNLYTSKYLGYDQKLNELNKTTELHGYFQTWRYPIVAREVILNALKNRVFLNDHAQDLINNMKFRRILVVHIRLGDYKNLANSFIGVLSPNYYGKILKRPELQEYQVFVFSDDILGAKSEYSKSFPSNTTWVDEGNILDPIETLAVMSHGKAFVIANSTFSWWSAFLSEDPDIIIAPSKWFKDKADPEDLIPSNWHREVSQWAN